MVTARRNGQLSSCEPCRKAKLRCDHKSPTCGQCLRRGQANDCFYHPAPLTQSPRPDALVQKRDGSRRPTAKYIKNQVTFRVNKGPFKTTPTPTTPLNSGTKIFDQYVGQWNSMTKLPLSPGYLSHALPSNILNESRVTSGEGDQNHGYSPDASALNHPPEEMEKIRLGAQVLNHLNEIRWLQEVIEVKNKVSPGWFLGPPFARVMCAAIEKVYKATIQGSSDSEVSLLNLSAEIFANTSKQIEVVETMTMPEYMSMIAPRWETIGLFFAVLGTATFDIPVEDPVFTHSPGHSNISQLRTISCAGSEICYEFCNNSGIISDPFCWLATQQTVLLNHMAGRGDSRTWQKMGDLSTIIYTLCLHRSILGQEERCPFFLTEIRKRVLACAYSVDKELATTVGLPVRISSRYCQIELPLDLSYEEIIATPSEVEQALQKLDHNGWNTNGNLTLEIRLRVALLTSFMRENILELSMSYQTDDLLDRVKKMINESHQMQESLPLFLRWTPKESESNCIDESRSMTHLEFTYQEFLLHRIALKRLGIRSKELVDTSCEIISTLLDLTKLRTRSAKSMQDVAWDLCHMGLPAAGILTAELLKKDTTVPQNPTYKRSQMIQKLSIFASHLRTFIESSEGLYEVAQQGASMVCKVLDQVLSVDSFESVPLASGIYQSDNWLGNDNMGIGEDDFMSWIGNIDWGQDSWLHFS